MRTRLVTLAAFAFAIVAISITTRAHASCGSDAECKGNRICSNGICVDPSPIPSPDAHTRPSVYTGPPSPAMREEKKGITGLIIAGPIVLGVSWLATIGVTAGLGSDGDLIGFSAIPLAGPWIMMADERTEDYLAALAVSGVVQLGGLTMLILGVSIRRTVRTPVYGDVNVEVTPMVGPGTAGAALTAAF